MPEYRLLQRHKINNVWQEPGFEFSCTAQHGDWMVQQGQFERIDVAEPVTPAPMPPQRLSRPIVTQPLSPRWSCCGKRNT